jgi:SAM-dependent methyltransferase
MKNLKLYLPRTGSSQEIHEVNFNLLRKLMKIKIEKIIEFGVGYGNFAEKVINLFKPSIYVGIDINEEVKLKIPKIIELLILDLNNDKIPYPDEYFDLGIACEVIEHLANPDNLLSEASRVIKKGGYFLISTPNLASWLNRILLMLGLVPIHYEISWKYRLGDSVIGLPPRKYIASGHIKLYTYHALLEHLRLYNFIPVKQSSIKYSLQFTNKYVNKLYHAMNYILSFSPSLSNGFAILAKKI